MDDAMPIRPRRHRGDIMSPEKRSAVMSRIRGKNTGIELAVVNALTEEGIKFECHAPDLPGRPDVVFRSACVAVFVDGDFWHGWQFPTWRDKLSEKWEAKIASNIERDQRNQQKLCGMGWKVLRIWEHEVKADVDGCVGRIIDALNDAPIRFGNNSILAPEIRTLDLFCGGGGSSWGARAAGATIVAGVDAWELASMTFAANFDGAKVVRARLDGRSTRKVLGDIGRIDLLLASPECTNHTCAKGNAKRDEASRRTARYVLNYARTFKPRWVIIENVVQMERWDGYQPLLDELRKYYFLRVQKLNAVDFGVPQTRRRLFIMCDRDRIPPEVIPLDAEEEQTARSIVDLDGGWPSKPLRNGKRAESTIKRADRGIEAIGTGKPFLVVYYGSDGSGGWQPLSKPLRTVTTLDRFGLIDWRGGEPTLRMLQVPELKRAMGFPDAFKLPEVSRRDRIRLLGNSVCPPVMEAIVRTLTMVVPTSAEILRET